MFCTNCGKEVCDNAVVCTQCGCYVNGNETKINKAQKSSKNKIVDLIMIISFAVYWGLILVVRPLVGVDHSTYMLFEALACILLLPGATAAFVVGFMVEKKYSKILSILLFIYACAAFVQLLCSI